MLNTRINMHSDLLRSAFRRFDCDNSGFITVDNLREVLGDSYGGEDVEKLLAEADMLKDNQISYAEFVAFVKGTPLAEAEEFAVANIIDQEIERKRVEVCPASPTGRSESIKFWTMPKLKFSMGSPRGEKASDDQTPGSRPSSTGSFRHHSTDQGQKQPCCAIS